MHNALKALIVIVLIALIGIVAALKNSRKNSTPAERAAPAAVAVPAESVTPAAALPKLIDLGAGKCIPCKAMKPILDDLAANYKDTFGTVFIDVWEHPEQAKPYNINLIPTQIFLDNSGKELFRHEGFFSKEDILAKWKELGIELTQADPNTV